MLLVVALTGLNALALFATAVWLVAIRYDGGFVRACVDCLGEGFAELVVFIGLQAVGVACLAQVLLKARGAKT